MVGHNWFLPEVLKGDGSGVSLASTVPYVDSWNGFPLHGGQPCGALLQDGTGQWRTSLDASGICLFGIGVLPVRIELPGGVVAVAEIGLRPSAWARNLTGVPSSDPLQSDRALWLRLFVDGAPAGETWSEWVLLSLDEIFPGDSMQLSAGWWSTPEGSGVYAHLLPFRLRYGGGDFVRGTASFAVDESRQFGVGASLSFPLSGVFPGPGPVVVRAAGVPYLDVHGQPCRFFTGHVAPLEHTIPFLPDAMTVSERFDAYPDNPFGWFDHPSAAAVGHLPYSLTMTEADVNPEWEVGAGHVGPRHLGALAHYPYSDHAVVPGPAGPPCNLAIDDVKNGRLARLRLRWTVPKARYWGLAFGVTAPEGDYTVEADVDGHGAWGEWATLGVVSTDQSGTTTFPGPTTYTQTLTGFAFSLSLCRHTLGNLSGNTQPASVERVAMYELRLSFWMRGTWLEISGGVGTAGTWQRHELPGSSGRIYLRAADMDALLNGQKVTLANPYSPDGQGQSTPFVGTLEITAIGPP